MLFLDDLLSFGSDDLSYGVEQISLNGKTRPLYTLSASANNALSISRTHPLSPSPTIQICDPTYTTPTAESPLMAFLFPKLAELMAIDQSSSTSSTHRLNRQNAAGLQSEAVMRAQSNEGSSLLWDGDSDKYCLVHPTLLDGTSTAFPMDITRDDQEHTIREISIVAPETNSAVKLLSLDLDSCVVTINALPICGLPSLYIFDTLVSALLVLLLHLHRVTKPTSNPDHGVLLEDMPTTCFPPPPTVASARSSRALNWRLTQGTVIPWRSKSRAKNRVSNDDEEAVMGSPIVVASTREEAQIVQPFQPLVDVDDRRLPKTTRIIVKGIYWIFEVMVWILGLVVNLLAACVVGISKAIPKL